MSTSFLPVVFGFVFDNNNVWTWKTCLHKEGIEIIILCHGIVLFGLCFEALYEIIYSINKNQELAMCYRWEKMLIQSIVYFFQKTKFVFYSQCFKNDVVKKNPRKRSIWKQICENISSAECFQMYFKKNTCFFFSLLIQYLFNELLCMFFRFLIRCPTSAPLYCQGWQIEAHVFGLK